MTNPQPEPIDCRLTLRHEDFIMSNHRVHGVSVLPGVTFLDIVFRVLDGSGLPTATAELRQVVFAEAIATAPGSDREIRVLIGPPAAGGRPVRGESRWLRDGRPEGEWRENFRAVLVLDGPEPPFADALFTVPPVPADGSARIRPMADMYRHTRSREITHGGPMRCAGSLRVGPSGLVAELDLQEPDASDQDAFRLHPAKLDAATIVAYGQREISAAEPFIPMFIERFRAPGTLPGRFTVHVPRPETLSASGELFRSDLVLYDHEGRLAAEFTGLSCKRVREPELMRRLLTRAAADRAPGPVPVPEVTGGPAGDGAGAYTAWLRTRIGALLGRPAASVDERAGFYDMGLSSVDMLGISGDLEEITGIALYPTLLFEHATVAALAAHLATLNPAPRTGAQRSGEQPSEERRSGAVPAGEAALYRPVWTPLPASGEAEPVAALLLVGDDPALEAALRAALPPGARLVTARPAERYERRGADAFRLDPADREQCARLFAEAGGPEVPWTVVSAAPADGAPDRVAVAAWALCAAAARAPRPVRALLFPYHLDGDGVAPPAPAAVAALCRTVTAELPSLRCRAVELDAGMSATATAAALLTEAARPGAEAAVRLRAGSREALRFLPSRNGTAAGTGPVALRDEGHYLITGGAGGLGLLVAGHLASTRRARLTLAGRRPLPDAVRASLAAWERAGAAVEYHAADVTDPAAVAALIASARRRFGPLRGVLHGAGTLRDGLFPVKSPSELAEVLAPKVLGLAVLDEATRDEPLDFLAAFSSLAASVGNPGQCDYAYANAYLEHYLAARAARGGRPGRSVAVGWPLWADGGMRVTPEVLERAARRDGSLPLPTTAGLALLETALAGPDERVVATYGDPGRAGSPALSISLSALRRRWVLVYVCSSRE
ncbi:SDR family NAD(P)-dependent oxidoreductase [Streptomyces specialis]|uniref:SDR family NAD(P)-dependent oxidoreductase n=1 Tax=Streptomyces specialis TaxID=498367 RepID=UPI00073EBE48|nr:SDR family NAD(P)-dependent oxidoreductase [Streptomyces specialis]